VTLALVATSPYTLLHGTEVMTEAPYIACSLGILLLILKDESAPTRGVVVASTTLLAFLPFLRTIGVVLIASVALWGALRRSRWRWSAMAAVALLPTILWSWRNHVVGGPTYVSNVLIDFSASGPAAFLKKAAVESWAYVERLIDVTLPGFSVGTPMYERVIVGGAPDLGGLWGMVVPVGILVLVLAVAGMVTRRDREGGLVVTYVVLSLAALAIYPPKNERLAWPLVPLLWAYVPVGLQWAGGFFRRRSPRLLRPVTVGALLTGVALTAWQASLTWKTVQSNVRWHREGERFYADAPPSYYADWRAAGRWLGDRAPSHARVLTRHSDLGLTSRRFQESLRFEETSPLEWRREIARYGVTYLAVPTTLFGKFFPLEAMGDDPVYELEPIYRERDVMILEVRPDRSGAPRTDAPGVEQDMAACREALTRLPRRVDLVRRCAELALASFQTAAGLPRAALLPRTIERGIRRAEEGWMQEPVASPGRAEMLGRVVALEHAGEEATAQQYLSLAIDLARDGLPGRALALLESGIEEFPESREIRMRLADLYLFYGQPERSEPLYRDLVRSDPNDPQARTGATASAARLESPSF
jgi:tetratricopeptide (TPR) repeat protein